MPIFYGNQQFPFRPSPKFTGDSFPTPPQQLTPNQFPTTKLPLLFVAATSKLFEQGLADPRGCEYREIEVGTGNCWQGDSGVMKVHGWVIPTSSENQQGFAVCWNGLVYPVVSIGAKADIHKDISLALKEMAKIKAKERGYENTICFYSPEKATPESYSLCHTTLLSINACLLLQLGEVEIAEAVWSINWDDKPERKNDDVNVKDPYLMLASEWLWALFDRAICAHMREDDKLALLSAELLFFAGDGVEKEAKQRGFNFHRLYQYKNSEPHFFPFLEQVPPLLTDQERRAKQPQRQQALTVGLENYPNQQERISALIQDLEEVAVLQNGQPGYPHLRQDPITQALIAEREAAIEPLLMCLANDTRLTRSVAYFRDFVQDRFILGVHEAAYVAISAILKTGFLKHSELFKLHQGMEGRQEVIAEIRHYLELNPIQRKLYRERKFNK